MFDPDNRAHLEALYSEMRPHHLYPLWEVMQSLVTSAPASAAKPWKWDYAAARDYLLRAGNLISAEKAERRVLILENPGLPGSSAITTSLYAGLQLILPGEVARCHRHTPAALRFILEGDGAYTAVDGEKVVMRPFDLVLTPNWQWHDHGNTSSEPMIWLDGLDIPTVLHFDAGFAESYAQPAHPETKRPANQPPFHYPYSRWRDELQGLAKSAPDLHLGHLLGFGPIMPTISAHARLLPAGFETSPRRATDGTIFAVVEGRGRCMIGDQKFNLNERDVFVVPSWRELRLQADADLVLFGYSDRSAQEKLGLYREARA